MERRILLSLMVANQGICFRKNTPLRLERVVVPKELDDARDVLLLEVAAGKHSAVVT
jgi:hypothetical protein